MAILYKCTHSLLWPIIWGGLLRGQCGTTHRPPCNTSTARHKWLWLHTKGRSYWFWCKKSKKTPCRWRERHMNLSDLEHRETKQRGFVTVNEPRMSLGLVLMGGLKATHGVLAPSFLMTYKGMSSLCWDPREQGRSLINHESNQDEVFLQTTRAPSTSQKTHLVKVMSSQ